MGIEDENYWGLQLGIGARTKQLKHFGFQFHAYYKFPFKSDLYAYIGSQAGVSYTF